MTEAQPTARALLGRAKELLLANDAWRSYVRDVYSVDPGGYPFLTYVGLNFTRSTIKNYKFYFSFFRRLQEAEIQRLLPVKDRGRFDEFYETWHPTHRYETIHRGVTFALKIDAQGGLTYYYHLRTAGLPFGPPERLALHPSDRDNHHGVCEEFSSDARSLKKYFYLRHPETIAESLRISGLEEVEHLVPAIDWLEYIESDRRDKVTWISGHEELVEELIDQRGPPRLSQGLARIRRDCGFELFGPGSATDRIDHSVYFVLPAGPLTGGGYLFDGVSRFLSHHLKIERTA